MKGRNMRSSVSRSVTDDGVLQKLRMCLLERNAASRNWVKSADKITENHADFIIAVTGVRQKLKTDSQCESVLLRCLTPARLIRMNQITSDEDSSNQLLRLYHTSSSGLRRTTAVIKKSARIRIIVIIKFIQRIFLSKRSPLIIL